MADVRPGADDVYTSTREQLHGVAEILIAGPQHRAHGTIRLSVRADGFAGVVLPIAVEGMALVWPRGRAALDGSVKDLALAAGVEAGPPVGVYSSVAPLASDDVLRLDSGSVATIHRSLHVGAQALKTLAPDLNPVLWPEHFDVAVSVAEVN